MNLDELKDQWTAQDAPIERAMRINVNVLRTTGPALRRLTRLLWIEIAVNALLVLAIGSFLGDHIRQPEFAIPAAALHLAAIALLGFGIHQLVMLKTEYDAPVVKLQQRLARLRTHRIRATQLTLLASPLLWLPILIVFLKAVLGISAYEIFEMRWILANILFGVAFIPLMIWIARLLAPRFNGAPLVNTLAGKTMNDAVAFLDELADFTRSSS